MRVCGGQVVFLAEKAGKHVELLVVPGTDPNDAMMQTARLLQASRIVTGLSLKMDPAEQGKLVGQAWERLPPPRPSVSLEIVTDGGDPRMLGFFSGVPYPEQSNIAGAPPHLDRVFLYQRNIERYSRTNDEVEEEIRKTLLHETGHFFGLSEEELEAMGLG